MTRNRPLACGIPITESDGYPRLDLANARSCHGMRPLDPDGGEAMQLRVRLPVGVMARVDDLAEREGTTRSDVIRTALSALLDQRETAA